MKYLKEILKAKRDKKTLPSLAHLIKQYGLWYKCLHNTDVFKNAIPWITFSAIDFLNRYLKGDMKVFEYGGGGSTLFFSSRVNELVTIEHNRDWSEALRKVMQDQTNVRWDGNFIEAEDVAEISNPNPSNPSHYVSEDVTFKNKSFKQYASFIDTYPDEYFDVVLVDGRARPSCLKHSLTKVKKNGLLILDNADRSYYLEYFHDKLNNYKLELRDFGPTPYVKWFTQTNIWRRIE